jgi:hypothetical protein
MLSITPTKRHVSTGHNLAAYHPVLTCEPRSDVVHQEYAMKTIALGFSVLFCALIMLAWSQPVRAGQAGTTCHVIDVATFSDRIHVHQR